MESCGESCGTLWRKRVFYSWESQRFHFRQYDSAEPLVQVRRWEPRRRPQRCRDARRPAGSMHPRASVRRICRMCPIVLVLSAGYWRGGKPSGRATGCRLSQMSADDRFRLGYWEARHLPTAEAGTKRGEKGAAHIGRFAPARPYRFAIRVLGLREVSAQYRRNPPLVLVFGIAPSSFPTISQAYGTANERDAGWGY